MNPYIAVLYSRRSALALALFIAALVVIPLIASNYLVSIMIVLLFSAYLGQAWNLMMGYAGQLSLGHALYVGVGAYISGALFVHYGLTPWVGMLAGMAAAGLLGIAIAALSFQFGVSGVYFALLTIAFAEFARIAFNHFAWVGGSSGLFLPVLRLTGNDVLRLRGSPTMFYYILLALTLTALAVSYLLLGRRVGFYWRAIREDQAAAQAAGVDVFRYKIAAVALSAVMTAIAGTLMAFYDNNLYPNTTFGISRSIDIITAPIIGGLGTLFGPILGAVVLTVLSEATTSLSAYFGIDGVKQWIYGSTLLIIVMLQPAGLWPWLRARLRLDREEG
jgi:branched-chain amino acid transport system permease protein